MVLVPANDPVMVSDFQGPSGRSTLARCATGPGKSREGKNASDNLMDTLEPVEIDRAVVVFGDKLLTALLELTPIICRLGRCCRRGIAAFFPGIYPRQPSMR